MLSLTWITNKALLWGTGSSAERCVAAWMGGEFGGQWIQGYMCLLSTWNYHNIVNQWCSCLVPQSCLTLCNPMDWGPPGSSVHGISQARILEWVAISFSRGSSWPRDQTCVSCIGRWILYHWAIREALLTSYCFSVAKLHPILFDPMDRCMPGSLVLHYFLGFAQIHVHWVSDAYLTTSSSATPSPFAFSLSQHQGLLQWVNSLKQVDKVLELQLHHQSFQWIFRTDFL